MCRVWFYVAVAHLVFPQHVGLVLWSSICWLVGVAEEIEVRVGGKLQTAMRIVDARMRRHVSFSSPNAAAF